MLQFPRDPEALQTHDEHRVIEHREKGVKHFLLFVSIFTLGTESPLLVASGYLLDNKMVLPNPPLAFVQSWLGNAKVFNNLCPLLKG